MLSRLFGDVWPPSPSMVVAFIALLIAGGGATYAAIPDSDDREIHGCYSNRDGDLRVLDAQSGDSCGSRETPLAWNQQGVPGTTGQGGVTVFSTAGATSPDTFTLIPNLRLTLDVPAGSVLYLSTDGGAQAHGGFALVDVAIYIDGVRSTLERRIHCGTDEYCDWSMAATTTTLSPGAHTIEVRAVRSSSSTGSVTVGGSTGSGTQGQLTVLTIKK